MKGALTLSGPDMRASYREHWTLWRWRPIHALVLNEIILGFKLKHCHCELSVWFLSRFHCIFTPRYRLIVKLLKTPSTKKYRIIYWLGIFYETPPTCPPLCQCIFLFPYFPWEYGPQKHSRVSPRQLINVLSDKWYKNVWMSFICEGRGSELRELKIYWNLYSRAQNPFKKIDSDN